MPTGIASGFRFSFAGQEVEAEVVITAGRLSQHDLNLARRRHTLSEPVALTLPFDRVEFTEAHDRLVDELDAQHRGAP
jgi:hypothetical protein